MRKLKAPEPDLKEWSHMVERSKMISGTVHIGLIGKYVGLHDAYLSVAEALRHAGFYHGIQVEIHWIDSEELTKKGCGEILECLDGILVPGVLGSRGIEGMILAAKYAREKGLPFFGICLGMQVAVIEYARNVAGIWDAGSGDYEFNNAYRELLQDKGLIISGTSPEGRLVETVELEDRPFYVGVQYHPEFKSRPNHPHPLFMGFVGAAKEYALEQA